MAKATTPALYINSPRLCRGVVLGEPSKATEGRHYSLGRLSAHVRKCYRLVPHVNSLRVVVEPRGMGTSSRGEMSGAEGVMANFVR